MAELQPLDLTDFTGGLRRGEPQSTLAMTESPAMLNIELGKRMGFGTRRGWNRWNADDVGDVENWAPRNAFFHQLSTGAFQVLLANDAKLYASGTNAVFADLAVPCNAAPHLADFGYWGDTVYIATGQNAAALTSTPFKRLAGNAPVALADAAAAFNDDYAIPVGGRMPFADLAESHAGYLFCAFTKEGGTVYRNRIRWSHPDQPEDWATNDYIDIHSGGGHITGLMSFGDHLLIFKTSTIWALYGYNSESWQLVQVAGALGTPTQTAITRAEGGAMFYSTSGKPGIYVYTGEGPPILLSDQLNRPMRSVVEPLDVWLGWVNGRLFVSLPWVPEYVNQAHLTSTLVFDPTIGNGAWMLHRPALGSSTVIIRGSDTECSCPLAAVVDSGAACVVRLGDSEQAVDKINLDASSTPFRAFYRTAWQFGAWPERRKSWRRPRLNMEYVSTSTSLDIETFWDYNEASARRSHTFEMTTDGSVFWRLTGALEPDGFDWGDGSTWGAAESDGATLERAQPPQAGGSGLGVAAAVQLRVATSAAALGTAWRVNGIHLKYRLRRFTT